MSHPHRPSHTAARVRAFALPGDRSGKAAAFALLTLILLALLALAAPASADDRDLLRTSVGSPYVFVVFDTSGSMNYSTQCTAASASSDIDPTDGGCTFECTLGSTECQRICPNYGCVEKDAMGNCLRQGYRCAQPVCERDCFMPMNGDDPRSKFYQAKEALYEVIENNLSDGDVQFGFAHYNQDEAFVRSKHFLYVADEDGPTVPGWGKYPRKGDQDVFGEAWSCVAGNGDDRVGCYPTSDYPADLSDAWERQRMARWPKLADHFRFRTSYFIRHAGVVYRVEYDPQDFPNAGDNEVKVRIEIERCDDLSSATACSASYNRTFIDSKEVKFKLVSDFISWDNGSRRSAPENGYFPQTYGSSLQIAADANIGGSCEGWEGNGDSTDDPYSGYNLQFPTTTAPSFSPHLDRGDMLPLDWNATNHQDLLDRLAPNRLLGETTPDFRVARYFQDRQSGSERFVRLKNNNVRPMVPNGSTPLGFAIADFRTWWAGCQQGSCNGRTGWSDIAAANDPDWACRRKYLLVISDGDDTCPGRDPCSFTASLRAQENVFTYVVAFGVQNTSGNRLTCMASNGGTGDPIYPQNKQELVDALTAIFGEIREEARSFASAAVPNVQAVVEDKIFLSSFTPLNNESIWDGHLDAFLKPLPLDDAGKPDRTIRCSTLPADEQAACHLWDVGQELVKQAPTAAEVVAGDYLIGNATDERRIFYPEGFDLTQSSVPRDMNLFLPPSGTPAWRDLWDGLGMIYTATIDALDVTLNGQRNAVRNIIGQTVVQKEGTINNPDGSVTDITYVFGDVFHSNPSVLESPSDFRSYAADLYGNLGGADCASGNKGYRCFAQKHEFRRKMLSVGANDGMLHFFNSGIYDSSEEVFDNGDGSEVMAIMPRLTMPIIKELAEGTTQIFGVDGTSRVVDVFIDPVNADNDPVDPTQREWRTVSITSLREGGIRNGGARVTLQNGRPWTSGLFALDITQPDRLDSDYLPVNRNVVPTCITNYATANCGPVPFGSVLWEFTDSLNGSPAEWGTAFDEDNNNTPDLGDTWSTPVMGRIRVLDGSGGTEDRWVAIFGGGFDRDNRSSPRRGNWLYMVDVETGDTLYKERVVGAVPSNPAAVDRNRDGYLDALYFGTTAGYLYKVDLTTPVGFTSVNARDILNATHSVDRLDDSEWEPFVLFNASADGNRRPIFFPPTVVSIADTGEVGLAFGTGDRELLWDFNGNIEGRFYVIVDEDYDRMDAIGGTLPKDEGDYERIDSEGTSNPGDNFLVSPPGGSNRGWVLTLDPNERVVAQSFSVAGLTIFPTFKPQVVNTATATANVCARTGDSRVFAIFTTNADAVQPVDVNTGLQSRSILVGEALVTPPYADQSATKNPGEGLPEVCVGTWRDSIIATLKQLFPSGTRFANYTIEVNFVRSDTGVVCPIPVPIGIVEKNWREF